MPELPEVETMVRGIRRHCEGRILEQMEFLPCDRRPIPVNPSRAAFRSVSGRKIQRVGRLGKRAMLEMDGGQVIVIEPRMTGLLLVADPPTREHRRILWHLAPRKGLARTIEFWDRRGLGTVSLLSVPEMDALRTRLGPDALEITIEQWAMRLKRTDRPIKVALLDQALVAGIGNLYASEILHLSRISPRRRASSLRNAEVERMHAAVGTILHKAIQYEGSTLSDGTYRNALNEDGGFQNHHAVYDKMDCLCPACGVTAIRRIVQAQRSTFYCPHCQK